MSSLVDACPQLRVFSLVDTCVTGPAFAPLRRLRSLCSLRLSGLSTEPEEQRLVLSSLPTALTTLTELKLCFYEPESYEPAAYVDCQALLPWVGTGLQALQDLDIMGAAEQYAVAMEELGHSLRTLQHLTRLQVGG